MKLSPKDVRRENIKSTATWISQTLKEVDETELVSTLFIEANDDITKDFIRLFESQIILANINASKFKQDLYKFLKDTAKFIKKNKLQRELIYFFCYLFKENVKTKEAKKNKAFGCYISLIMEELKFLAGENKIIVGINSKNEFIFIPEPYLNIEIPVLMFEKHKDTKKLISDYKSYGYVIRDMSDIRVLFSNYNAVSNNLFQCSFLVNEHNRDMVAKKYYPINEPLNVPLCKNSDKIKSYLSKRKRFIKNGRVKVQLDAGDIKEVELNELFIENELFIYFKVRTKKDEEFNGFIELSTLSVNSMFSELVPDTDTAIGDLIFEVYALITSDIFKSETRHDDLKMVFHYKEAIDFKSNIMNKNSINHRNLENYQEELIDINYFIRKLPEGATASDEARELAQKYGFELSDGETFVRKFKKTIYKKK